MRPKTIIAVIIAIIVGIGILLKYSQPTPPPLWQQVPAYKDVQSKSGILLRFSYTHNRLISNIINCSDCGPVDLKGSWDGNTFVVERQGPHEYKLHFKATKAYWTEDETPIKGAEFTYR